MMIQKFLPEAPTKSTLHYEVYRNKNSSDEDFKLISEMYARVMAEDKVLCDRAQKNLNAGMWFPKSSFLQGSINVLQESS